MSETKFTYRIATEADAATIHQLIEAAFRAEDPRPNWAADIELGRSFRFPVEHVYEQIKKPEGAIILIIDEPGNIVGAVMVTKKPDSARMTMLAIDPTQQQAGVGRKLLAYAEQWSLEQWEMNKYALNALSTRELLIQWYERRGYVRIGTSPLKIKAGDAPMPEDWTLVEMEKTVAI